MGGFISAELARKDSVRVLQAPPAGSARKDWTRRVEDAGSLYARKPLPLGCRIQERGPTLRGSHTHAPGPLGGTVETLLTAG